MPDEPLQFLHNIYASQKRSTIWPTFCKHWPETDEVKCLVAVFFLPKMLPEHSILVSLRAFLNFYNYYYAELMLLWATDGFSSCNLDIF